jgi:hypothetical protein
MLLCGYNTTILIKLILKIKKILPSSSAFYALSIK